MDEPNAKRIFDFSNGRKTRVSIDGRAAPVLCEPDRQCGAAGGSSTGSGAREGGESSGGAARGSAGTEEPVPGLEGEMT